MDTPAQSPPAAPSAAPQQPEAPADAPAAASSAAPAQAPSQAPVPACPYCEGAPALPEQFYETKLFRVLVARNQIAPGQVVIIPKHHDPHFYSFTDEQLEEFGYLIKKVSFWVMRYTRTHGFTVLMNDGTVEVSQESHLQISVIPRQFADAKFTQIVQTISLNLVALNDEQVQRTVKELTDLMQMPQNNI